MTLSCGHCNYNGCDITNIFNESVVGYCKYFHTLVMSRKTEYCNVPCSIISQPLENSRNTFKMYYMYFTALFYRNLPLQNMADFQLFIQGLDYKFFEHGVTGYRTPLGSHVYTASDDPCQVTMEPHNEVSYSPVFPKKVWH